MERGYDCKNIEWSKANPLRMAAPVRYVFY